MKLKPPAILIAFFASCTFTLGNDLNGDQRPVSELAPVVGKIAAKAQTYPRPEIFNSKQCAATLVAKDHNMQYMVVQFGNGKRGRYVAQHPSTLSKGRVMNVSTKVCERIYDNISIDTAPKAFTDRQEIMSITLAKQYGHLYAVVFPRSDTREQVQVLLLYPTSRYSLSPKVYPDKELKSMWEHYKVEHSARDVTHKQHAFGEVLREKFGKGSFLAYVATGNTPEGRIVQNIVCK